MAFLSTAKLKLLFVWFPPKPSIDCINNVPQGGTIVNLLRPRDVYMRRWTWSSLVQIMVWCLFGAKPLSKPMLTSNQLEHKDKINEISKYEYFHSRKCVWKGCLENVGHLSRSQCVNSASCLESPPSSHVCHNGRWITNNIKPIWTANK